MASKGKAMAPTAPEFWCRICKLPFKTDGAFKLHKVNSDRHICCDVCGADFNSEEGKKRHRAAHHAEEQDLTCKFCGLNYPRVGSLINHYEESQCKNVSKEVFMQAIRDKMGHHEAVRKAHNFKDIRRSGDFSGQKDEPLPPFRQASVSPQTPLNAGGRASGGWTDTGVQNNGAQSADTQSGAWPSSSAQSIDAQEGSWDNGARDEGISNGGWSGAGTGGYGMDPPLINVIPEIPIGEDEDLISFDAQSAILNSPWSVSASDVLKNSPMFNKARDFPAMGNNGANQGVGQGVVHSGAPQGTAKQGPPHTWGKGGSSTAKSTNENEPIISQSSSQASANRGPPHTRGKANATADNANQNSINPANRVPPHLQGKVSASANIANPASSHPTPAAVAKPGVGVGATQNSAPNANIKPAQSPWGSRNLFPDAPPAVAPPADLLSSLSISTPATPAKVYKNFDPDDPSFKANRYYVDVIGKWKCPHQGCNSSFKTANSFIGHLKSPAHSDEKFQCLKCYRYYNSATALTQHAESQGVRCNVRDTDDFESVVRGITAGTTTTNGRLADDTVRYEINPDANLATSTTSKMAESYRAVTKARDEARSHYWDDKTPRW
ncbi:hypothetical protein BKA61DRAFT_664372 [Leptodontidium sp. MPI-SDFR-AT-0119]|nr:hypothetical protein BKA61DRAFT_664372 [Leptodontidium sp. MPI-SDFR-AT-0119]